MGAKEVAAAMTTQKADSSPLGRHGKNVNADNWRFAQLWRHVSNQAHPFSRFHTGNLETLLTAPKAKGLQVHEAVREFAASR